MFEKITNSWALIKASGRVLLADKELVVFPIISAIGVLLVSATFILPLLAADMFDALLFGQGRVLGYVMLFLFYVVQYTVIIFCNSALVGAALIRLRGGDPTVRDGFRIAFAHLGQVVGYALISATVGMILRFISERGKLGELVSSLVGMAWNVITYLAVPVLVVEDVGPIEAVKRSGALLKRTWGEQIVGNFGVGAIFGLATVGVILIGAAGIFVAFSVESALLGIVVILAVVLALLGLGLLNATLSGIYSAAVYRYAAEGAIEGYFDDRLVQGAFRPKKGR